MKMSLFSRLLPVIFCLSLCGCGDETAPPDDAAAAGTPEVSEESVREEVPPSSSKPPADTATPNPDVKVTIVSSGPKAPGQSESAGDHRSQRIIVSGATTQVEFEAAVRGTFEELAEEIEKSEKASTSKRVEVIAYDNDIDAEARDVYTLHAFSAVGPEKPSWGTAQLDWRWRLPEFRPSKEWLRIHADYRKLRATVEELSDAQKEVCAQHKLSDDEFIDLHAYMMMWHSGLAPEGELLDEWKTDLRKKSQRD